MALEKGDRLRIKRGGVLIGPSDEDYQEFEVIGSADFRGRITDSVRSGGVLDEKGKAYSYYDVRIRVIEIEPGRGEPDKPIKN